MKICFRVIVLVITAFFLTSISYSQDTSVFSYDDYAYILENYVEEHGLVNYKGIKKESRMLDKFINSLASISKKEYQGWKENDKLAFLINAYNAFTIKAIITNYPLQSIKWKSRRYPRNSIRQIPGVWKKTGFNIMSEKLTLDEIEHGILRRQFNEPRIHVALVCAALGCPKLRMEPYYGDKLAEQLDDQAKIFFATPKKFRINRKEKVVYLSSIFKWFGRDFVNKYGKENKIKFNKKENAVLNFLSRYLNAGDRKFILKGDYKLKYLRYDWTLNEQQDRIKKE